MRPRLIATRDYDTALELVECDDGRHGLEKSQRLDVRGQKLGRLLRDASLGVGVAGGTQGGDKQLEGDALSGARVSVVRFGAGVVDKRLLAADVVLAHDQAARLLPGAVAFTAGGAAQPVGVLLQVLLAEQLERDALSAQLQVDVNPVGFGARRAGRGRRWVEALFQILVVQTAYGGSVEAGARHV